MKTLIETRSHRRYALAGVLALIGGITASMQVFAEPATTTGARTATVDVRRVAAVAGDVAAGATKSVVCGACHGTDGNAVIPNYPSLAGQPIDYLYLQLLSFSKGWRVNAIMQAQVAALGDRDFRDLAAHYASLPRRTSVVAKADEMAMSKQWYLEGQTDKGVPPCQGCHGSNGEGLSHSGVEAVPGNPRFPSNTRTYPVLAGLSSGYVVAQLAAFKSGARGGTSNAQIMHGVAENIAPDTAEALGNYLETLGGR